MILLILISILILQAMSDGLFDRKKKKTSKLLECIYISLFFCLVYVVASSFNDLFFKQIVNLGLVYLFLRLSFYDVVENLSADRTIYHYGTTTYFYDKFFTLLKLRTWQWWIYRVSFAGIALIIYFKII